MRAVDSRRDRASQPVYKAAMTMASAAGMRIGSNQPRLNDGTSRRNVEASVVVEGRRLRPDEALCTRASDWSVRIHCSIEVAPALVSRAAATGRRLLQGLQGPSGSS